MSIFNRKYKELEQRLDALEKCTKMKDMFYKDVPINLMLEALAEYLNLRIRYSSPSPSRVIVSPKEKDTFV